MWWVETSGGSRRLERIIMHNESSSCRTLSMYIMSKSLTIAPLITIISSPLIKPEDRQHNKSLQAQNNNCKHKTLTIVYMNFLSLLSIITVMIIILNNVCYNYYYWTSNRYAVVWFSELQVGDWKIEDSELDVYANCICCRYILCDCDVLCF